MKNKIVCTLLLTSYLLSTIACNGKQVSNIDSSVKQDTISSTDLKDKFWSKESIAYELCNGDKVYFNHDRDEQSIITLEGYEICDMMKLENLPMNKDSRFDMNITSFKEDYERITEKEFVESNFSMFHNLFGIKGDITVNQDGTTKRTVTDYGSLFSITKEEINVKTDNTLNRNVTVYNVVLDMSSYNGCKYKLPYYEVILEHDDCKIKYQVSSLQAITDKMNNRLSIAMDDLEYSTKEHVDEIYKVNPKLISSFWKDLEVIDEYSTKLYEDVLETVCMTIDESHYYEMYKLENEEQDFSIDVSSLSNVLKDAYIGEDSSYVITTKSSSSSYDNIYTITKSKDIDIHKRLLESSYCHFISSILKGDNEIYNSIADNFLMTKEEDITDSFSNNQFTSIKRYSAYINLPTMNILLPHDIYEVMVGEERFILDSCVLDNSYVKEKYLYFGLSDELLEVSDYNIIINDIVSSIEGKEIETLEEIIYHYDECSNTLRMQSTELIKGMSE